jgi:hypothetical protein
MGRALAVRPRVETAPHRAIRRAVRDPYAISVMTGVFAQYQADYAQHGVATFPCSTETKKPLVKNYLKVSRGASPAAAMELLSSTSMSPISTSSMKLSLAMASRALSCALRQENFTLGIALMVSGAK